MSFSPLSCPNPVDPYQVIFHPVWADGRVRYPPHFKRFEVQMFAFADEKDDLVGQVTTIQLDLCLITLPALITVYYIAALHSLWRCDLWCQKPTWWRLQPAVHKLWNWNERFEELNNCLILSKTNTNRFVLSAGQKRDIEDVADFEHVSLGPIGFLQ